jgi:hypothetical protein
VKYGTYFSYGEFVEKDMKVYVEWLEKAANQKNPRAMDLLGLWFRFEGGDKDKVLSYYCAAAELGWKTSMYSLAKMLRDGEGCAKDLRQAVLWGAKGGELHVFWTVMSKARRALEFGTTEDLDCDFNQLCYSLGWGLYWYQYGSKNWNQPSDENKAFGIRCLAYYSSCVELQQKSIFTFLLCWNRTTGGVKGPGQMIAQMVWEEREASLVREFEESDGEELEMKQIKK